MLNPVATDVGDLSESKKFSAWLGKKMLFWHHTLQHDPVWNTETCWNFDERAGRAFFLGFWKMKEDLTPQKNPHYRISWRRLYCLCYLCSWSLHWGWNPEPWCLYAWCSWNGCTRLQPPHQADFADFAQHMSEKRVNHQWKGDFIWETLHSPVDLESLHFQTQQSSAMGIMYCVHSRDQTDLSLWLYGGWHIRGTCKNRTIWKLQTKPPQAIPLHQYVSSTSHVFPI